MSMVLPSHCYERYFLVLPGIAGLDVSGYFIIYFYCNLCLWVSSIYKKTLCKNKLYKKAEYLKMTFTYTMNNNKLAGSWEQELHLQKVSTPLAQFNSYAEPRTFFSTNNNSTKLWGINCITDLVFIDSQIEDYQSLVNGVLPGVKAVVLNSRENGVDQITRVIGRYFHISSVHIVSHGRPGCLYLGNGQLNLDNINHNYIADLQGWSVSNLLLYGCNVAAGDGGAEFLEKLHRVTGANIAASARPTGNVALGGDWELEVNPGNVDLRLPFRQDAIATYGHILSDNTKDTAKNMGNLGPIQIFEDWVGSSDRYDYYQFNLLENSIVKFNLSGLEGCTYIYTYEKGNNKAICPGQFSVNDFFLSLFYLISYFNLLVTLSNLQL